MCVAGGASVLECCLCVAKKGRENVLMCPLFILKLLGSCVCCVVLGVISVLCVLAGHLLCCVVFPLVLRKEGCMC